MAMSNELSLDLSNAVNGLYTAFAKYGRPTQVIGDMNVPYPADHPFHTKPLRLLTIDDFTCFFDYFWKAMTTVGTVDDYRYLLPRMLELLALETVRDSQNASSVLSPEVVLGKLTYDPASGGAVPFSHWPTAQGVAIVAYLDALWDWVLDRPLTWYGDDNFPAPDDVPTVDEWLTGIVRADQPLQKCLDRWRSKPSWSAAVRLADQLVAHHSHFEKGRYSLSAFLSYADARHEEMRRWLVSIDTTNQLKLACRRHSGAYGSVYLESAIAFLQEQYSREASPGHG